MRLAAGGSAARELYLEAAIFEFAAQGLAVVTLDLDHAFLEGSARAAASLQILGEIAQRIGGERHTAYGRDRLARAALLLAANPHDAIALCPGGGLADLAGLLGLLLLLLMDKIIDKSC